MPRLLTLTELFKQIDSLDLYTEKATSPASTTVPLAIAKSATTFDVASATNLATNDYFFLDGSGGLELNQATSVSSLTVTPKYKIGFAQNAGCPLIEAEKFQLGHLEQGGATYSTSKQVTPVLAATADSPLVYIEGQAEYSLSFGLLGFNGPNLLLSLGLKDNETGAGSSADPYQITIGPNETKLGRTVFRAQGTRHDGQNFLIDALNARFEASGQIQLNRQSPAPVPISLKFTNWIVRFWS